MLQSWRGERLHALWGGAAKHSSQVRRGTFGCVACWVRKNGFLRRCTGADSPQLVVWIQKVCSCWGSGKGFHGRIDLFDIAQGSPQVQPTGL